MVANDEVGDEGVEEELEKVSLGISKSSFFANLPSSSLYRCIHPHVFFFLKTF